MDVFVATMTGRRLLLTILLQLNLIIFVYLIEFPVELIYPLLDLLSFLINFFLSLEDCWT